MCLAWPPWRQVWHQVNHWEKAPQELFEAKRREREREWHLAFKMPYYSLPHWPAVSLVCPGGALVPAADMFIRQMEHLGRGFLQLGQLVSCVREEGRREGWKERNYTQHNPLHIDVQCSNKSDKNWFCYWVRATRWQSFMYRCELCFSPQNTQCNTVHKWLPCVTILTILT